MAEVARRIAQARRIRKLRRAAKMSQAELAAAIRALAGELQEKSLATGIDQTLVSYWESENPDRWVKLSDAQIAALAIVFGVSADYILGISEDLAGRE